MLTVVQTVVSAVVVVEDEEYGDEEEDGEEEHGDSDLLDSNSGQTTSGSEEEQAGQVNGPLLLELDTGAFTRHWHCPVWPGTSVSSTLKPSGVLVIQVRSCWGV